MSNMWYFQWLIFPTLSCWRHEEWRDLHQQDVICNGFWGVFNFTKKLFSDIDISDIVLLKQGWGKEEVKVFRAKKRGGRKKSWKKVPRRKWFPFVHFNFNFWKTTIQYKYHTCEWIYVLISPYIQYDAVMFVSCWIYGQSNRTWTIGTLSSKVEVSRWKIAISVKIAKKNNLFGTLSRDCKLSNTSLTFTD